MKYISAGYIFDGVNILDNHMLIVDDGVVCDIVKYNAEYPIDYLGNGIITPGFVDLQINGCGGVLFNSDISSHTLEVMRDTCLNFGTTHFFPTLITCEINDIIKALNVVDMWITTYGLEKGVIGLHLEGPFISKEKHGIHNPNYIILPEQSHLELIVSYARKYNIQMTIAPEVFSLDQIKYLSDAGVILSLGHSNASYEVAKNGFLNGITTVTHIFNAMNNLTGREPGVIGAIIDSDCYVSIIGDLLHVAPSNIGLLHRIKPDRLYLISDGITSMGTDIKEFKLAGKKIFVNNGKCVDQTGILGGGNIAMNGLIKNCVNDCKLLLCDVLKMAVSHPAKLLGLYDKLANIFGMQIDNLVYMDLASFNCSLVNKQSRS